MPQNKEVHKEYMRKYRQGSQDNTIGSHHPILDDLVDPTRRKKLEVICTALSKHNLQDKVFYGIGEYSLPVNIVGDLLDATMNRKGE